MVTLVSQRLGTAFPFFVDEKSQKDFEISDSSKGHFYVVKMCQELSGYIYLYIYR